MNRHAGAEGRGPGTAASRLRREANIVLIVIVALSILILGVALAVARDGGEGQEPLGPGPSGLRGGLPNFDFSAVTWNSYWYSRYNLGSLVMMSGLGLTFMPDMDAVQAMVQAVDQGPAEGEHVVLPKNPALLRAVFARGDPAFAQPFNGNPLDLTNWRWDPAQVDPTITPSAQAQTIIKEVEWAKFFNNAGWAGAPTDDFGAMDRFKGMVLFAEAKMQVDFALKEMRNPDGLFVAALGYENGALNVKDASVRLGDQFQMLQAIADVHSVLHSPEQYNNVYGDDPFHQLVAQTADELFRAIAAMEPGGIQESSLGAQALVWFAATTHDSALQREALSLLGTYGDQLIASQPTDVVERAQAIRGLLEAGRVLGDDKYLDAASDLFRQMADEYQPALGYFKSRTSLTIWEVGDILGALNALSRHGGDEADRAEVMRVHVGFFEAAVNLGGLLQAVPPKEMEASPFEIAKTGSDLFFGYPTIPTPDKAGGPYGRAPVDAAEITFDEEADNWAVSDATFDSAGAMHTSNEMVWTFGLVNGFPEVEGAVAAAR